MGEVCALLNALVVMPSPLNNVRKSIMFSGCCRGRRGIRVNAGASLVVNV